MSDKEKILFNLFSGNKQVPTLPAIFTEINRLMDNPFVTNKKIADLIMKDQAMVTKILKLSNSAMYSRRQEITNLANAITFLGTQTLKNIILQISLVNMFKRTDERIPEFDIAIFWENSLGSAFISDILVKKLKLPRNENYYIAGLLHGIGRLLIYQFYPEEFGTIIIHQINKNLSDIEAEEKVLGVNHCEIGGFLAEQWKFKNEIIDAIKNYKKPLPTSGIIVSIVRISDMFAKSAGLCFPWDEKVMDIVGDTAWQSIMKFTDQEIDVERLTFELLDDSKSIRDMVKDLLKTK